jgi:hypothetical protein
MRIVSFFQNECRSSIYTLIVVFLHSISIKILFNKNIIAHTKAIIIEKKTLLSREI